jgi:predicted enzyme related to lactoylglutathione lyase
MSGKVVHFEIPADDAERAQQFYGDVFGWQLQPMPEANYTMVTTGPSGDTGPTEPGYINGGMFTRSEEASQHPVLVVDVEDIDAALQKVEEAGGKTLSGRMDVMGMGWAAYFTDPEGNITGLWQNAPQ